MVSLTKIIQGSRREVSLDHHFLTLQKHAARSSVHAFSTIELLITILILALLATFSASHLSRGVSLIKIHAAANNLASDMHRGRRRAISENTLYRVVFDTTGNSYKIDKDSGGNWQNVNPLQPLPNGIELETATTNPIYFQTLGTVTAGGTITLRNFQDQRRRVSVSRSGRINVKKVP